MDQRRQRSRRPVARLFDWSKFDPAMVESDGRPSLVEELTTYRDRLPELIQHEGAYVVIKGKAYQILPDREAALRYAMEQYGPEPVLVKKIVGQEPLNSLGGASL
jgi:UDP-N-acetylmuramyl tripeptide synthase